MNQESRTNGPSYRALTVGLTVLAVILGTLALIVGLPVLAVVLGTLGLITVR